MMSIKMYIIKGLTSNLKNMNLDIGQKLMYIFALTCPISSFKNLNLNI